MGDNAFYYAFKVYGRRVDYQPFQPLEFCRGKATGSYVNHNLVTVDCENDSFNGGWTKIFTYQGEEVFGDKGVVYGSLPLWYTKAEGAPFDQYMWVDEGTKLDFAHGSAAWTIQGYDAGKHYFFAEDGSNWKIKDKGSEEYWAFRDQCTQITDYQVEGDTGACMHGEDNLPDACFHKAMFDFSQGDQ